MEREGVGREAEGRGQRQVWLLTMENGYRIMELMAGVDRLIAE